MQDLMTLAVLGFASYRATQLVVWDSIGDGPRERLKSWHMNGVGPGRSNRLRTFVLNLTSCTYCSGWWLSLITLAVYLTAAGQWGASSVWVHAVEFWAVAGIQALLNRWDDSRPGHHPEGV